MSGAGSGETGARAFSPLAVGLMIAAGVFAFAAFAVLSAYAPELRRGNDGREHALSQSAVGFASAVRLLEARGVPTVVLRRNGTGSIPDGPGLLIVTLGQNTDEKAVRALTGDRFGSLIVLPKWTTEPDRRRLGWVRQNGLIPPPVVAELLKDVTGKPGQVHRGEGRTFNDLRSANGFIEGGLRSGPVRSPQTISGPGLKPLLVDGDGRAVLASVEGKVGSYVLADPDFLNTQGLSDIRTARTAFAIVDQIRPQGRPIAFDLTLHGFGSGRSLLKLAFAPPFLAATLCAAAGAALAAWQAVVRFGPHHRAGRAFALGKQALADNAALLIAQSGREPRMARRYAELVQARAAAAVAAPAGDVAETAAYLDRLGRTAPDAPALSALLDRSRAVSSRAQLLDVARRLHQWRREIAREPAQTSSARPDL